MYALKAVFLTQPAICSTFDKEETPIIKKKSNGLEVVSFLGTVEKHYPREGRFIGINDHFILKMKSILEYFKFDIDSKFSSVFKSIKTRGQTLEISFDEKNLDEQLTTEEIIKFLQHLLSAPLPQGIKHLYISLPLSRKDLRVSLESLDFSLEKDFFSCIGDRYSHEEDAIFHKKALPQNNKVPLNSCWKHFVKTSRFIEELKENIQNPVFEESYWVLLRNPNSKEIIGKISFDLGLLNFGYGAVDVLLINEKYQNQGFENQILQEAETLLKERGVKSLKVYINGPQNRGQFLTTLGYKKIQSLKKYAALQDGNHISFHEYEKDLM